MNKIFFPMVVVIGFLTTAISADALKNTLMNLKPNNSASSMMGYGNLGVNKKPKKSQQSFKRRSSKTVLATVNGHKIRKKDADKYLKKVTKGKIKDYDRLPKKQRKLLLSDLKKIYKAKYFKGRSGDTVIGHYDDNTSVYKKEADTYVKKVTKGKVKDLDMLPRKQRLLVLKDLQKMYSMKHFKSRPKETIIATVNEHNITKGEADNYIAQVTQGNIKDFDRLDEKQKSVVIQDLVRPVLLANEAQNNMTEEEKALLFRQVWIDKQMAKTEVSNEEMLAFYESMKKETLAKNPNAKIPPYISLGDRLKKQVLEKKIIEKLMKGVEIVVNDDSSQSTDANDSNKTPEMLGKISQQ
jgi:hypothetical protein